VELTQVFHVQEPITQVTVLVYTEHHVMVQLLVRAILRADLVLLRQGVVGRQFSMPHL